MTAYNVIADSQVDPESAIDTVLAVSWRDNPIAISEGSSGAPKIKVAALDASDVGYRKLIERQTASASATIEFVTGIDSTFKYYEIEIINAVPSVQSPFQAQASTDSGSTWLTGSVYKHGTTSWNIMLLTANSDVVTTAAYAGLCSLVKLFHPSSTSENKKALFETIYDHPTNGTVKNDSGCRIIDIAGIDGIKFYFTSGNIVSGEFRLYGVY